MKLDNNNHSVFAMFYHLILVVKYRRSAIDNLISERLKKAQPNSELSKFINAYKSASSRLIKKEYPSIRLKLWREYFWSRSFCLLTTGGAPIEVIKRYIESQGEKL